MTGTDTSFISELCSPHAAYIWLRHRAVGAYSFCSNFPIASKQVSKLLCSYSH